MAKDDDKEIWSKFITEGLMDKAVDFGNSTLQGKVAGGAAKAVGVGDIHPLTSGKYGTAASDEEVEGCPNLERLINSEDEEDGEVEQLGVDDEPEAFEKVAKHTPL